MTTYELRALSVGEILDGALAVYRGHFAVLAGIAAVCTGVPAILNSYMSMGGFETTSAGVILLWLVLYGVGSLIATGATIHAISQAYLGMDPTLVESLKFALRLVGKIFVAGLVKYLVLALPLVVSAVTVGIVTALVPDPMMVGLFAMLLFVGTIIATAVIAAGYGVVTQAIVLERDTSAIDGLRRSWDLTSGFKLKVVGVGAVMLILLMLPMVAATVLAVLVPALEAVISGLSAILQLIVYPAFAGAFTLLYYDLRVRKEAFDIQYLGDQLGMWSEP
jgi:hypothetical protein